MNDDKKHDNIPATELLNMGFDKEEIITIVKHLSQQVGEAFMYEMLTTLPKDELVKMDESLAAGTLSEEDRLEKLAKFYTEKMGMSPLERVQELLKQYITLFIKSLRQLKALNEKIESTPEESLKKLDEVLKSKDWGKIKAVLDEIGLDEKMLTVEIK